MVKALPKNKASSNLPVPSITPDQLPTYPSLSECLERISVLFSQVQEEEILPSSPPLKRLVREVQELMQILSIYQNFSIISPSIDQQEKIKYMAFYDGLTGLPNRHFFEMHLHQLMKPANLESIFYLIFLDLDGFKKINDTYGHETGDKLLKQVAKRLRQRLRKEDVVSRYGGDEFTILLNYHEKQDLDFILQRLISSVSQTYFIDHIPLTIKVSIGVAKYPVSAVTFKELINKADKAMYVSKSKGSNFYTLSF